MLNKQLDELSEITIAEFPIFINYTSYQSAKKSNINYNERNI